MAEGEMVKQGFSFAWIPPVAWTIVTQTMVKLPFKLVPESSLEQERLLASQLEHWHLPGEERLRVLKGDGRSRGQGRGFLPPGQKKKQFASSAYFEKCGN